jgi:hypothetical protein
MRSGVLFPHPAVSHVCVSLNRITSPIRCCCCATPRPYLAPWPGFRSKGQLADNETVGRCGQAIFGAVAAAGLVGVLLASSATAGALNCSDFASQAAAQSYFLSHGGPSQDPAGLDPDRDGLACESNPPPYRGLITLHFSSANNDFTGRVRSVSASCITPRTVQIFRVKDGTDRLVSSTQTRSADPYPGGYRVAAPSARGMFYARTVAKGYCAPDQSPSLRYPAP